MGNALNCVFGCSAAVLVGDRLRTLRGFERIGFRDRMRGGSLFPTPRSLFHNLDDSDSRKRWCVVLGRSSARTRPGLHCGGGLTYECSGMGRALKDVSHSAVVDDDCLVGDRLLVLREYDRAPYNSVVIRRGPLGMVLVRLDERDRVELLLLVVVLEEEEDVLYGSSGPLEEEGVSPQTEELQE